MRLRTTMLTTFLMFSASAVSAAVTQVGDLRIGSGTYSGAYTYFDPGFGALHGETTLTTRAVAGAPVDIFGDFAGTTQNVGGASPDSATDIGLRTHSSVTSIRTLNRFATTVGGFAAVGAVRWEFDLTPLDLYLSNNQLALTALDLRIVADASDETRPYDVYLSYTNAAESITQTDIGTTAGTNHALWALGQSSSEGSVIGGTHKILELDFVGDMDETDSLLALYNAGVKKFDLVMTSAAFLSSRNINIAVNSGLSITTVPFAPEPSTIILAVVGLLGLPFGARRRRIRA